MKSPIDTAPAMTVDAGSAPTGLLSMLTSSTANATADPRDGGSPSPDLLATVSAAPQSDDAANGDPAVIDTGAAPE